jgi:hypothetical protein
VRGPIVPLIFEARAAAAVDGRAHLAAFGVPVGRVRVLAQVHARKAQAARSVNQPRRVGQAEVIKVDGRLAVVHPVVKRVELAPHLAVPGELARHGVPQKAAALVKVRTAAQRVKQRPVVITLVAVVRAVHARPRLPPHERAVRPGVARLKNRRGLVHRVDQMTLRERQPGGRRRRSRRRRQ